MCAANPAERVAMKFVVQQLQIVVESTLPEDHLDPPPAPDNYTRHTREYQLSTIYEHPDISSDEVDEMDFGGNFPDDISDDSTSKAEDVLNTSSGEAEEMKFGGNFPVSNNSKRTSKPEEVLNRLAKLAELGVLGKASADRNAELAFVETVDEYEHPDFQSSIRIVMEEIEDQLDDIESPASPMDRHNSCIAWDWAS
ncbi:hypothetical protein PR002_g16035 [Phytophthora rubi]|uniref:Uncharacterized protein n=1 Tax=Phytophthora rubi TaxID=129364 RepID=A0A6A3KLU2_9STRA|nr:hypothetical protein PR002_g16035 [Phytophthora rubi]